MVRAVKWVTFILLIALYSQKTIAQSIVVSFRDDTVSSALGKTFTNRLAIQNTGKTSQTIFIKTRVASAFQMLFRIPASTVLLPGETTMIPLKGLVYNLPDLEDNPFLITLSDSTGKPLKTATFMLRVQGQKKQSVSLYVLEENIILTKNNDLTYLPLRIVHNIDRQETVFVDVTSMPEGINSAAFPLPVNLSPNLDTTLLIPCYPQRNWSMNVNYQLAVRILNGKQEILGTAFYRLVMAVTNRCYIDPIGYQTSKYGVAAAVTSFGKNQWGRETRLWGSDSIGKGQLDFHLQYASYSSGNYQQLQNSFLSYTINQTSIRLGTLYDYHELPLYGRGLRVNIRQPVNQWTLWAINANPNWLSRDENAWRGNVFSVRYDHQIVALPGAGVSVSSSYFTQCSTAQAGYLNFVSFQYDRPDRSSLRLLGGQSVEFAGHNPDRLQTMGWAGLLSYAHQGPRLNWQVRSYVSSPVYSGLQKGATLLYGQAGWYASARTTLLARLNYVRYDRILQGPGIEFDHQISGNSVAEVSVSHQAGRLRFGLRPYWFSQTDRSNPYSQRADAYRVVPSLSYQHRANRRIDLSYDAGIFFDRTNQTGPTPSAGVFSQRIISSIMLGSFCLWSYVQKGPYFLFDLRGAPPGEIMTASITPMMNVNLFDHKVSGSIGFNYLYDSFLKTSRYIAVGRLQYDIVPSLSLLFSGNGTPYSPQPELAYSLYRLEVIKQLSSFSRKQRGRLKLNFFEDTNGNGSKDVNEHWLDNLVVTVNDNTMITNDKGGICYRNIPPGTYTVSAISANRAGDPILYQEKMTIVGSVNRQIALTPTFRLRGQLQCQTNVYDRQPCPFNRFSVEIQRGEETISSTNPLPDGSFSVHLIPGNYTILLRDYNRQQQSVVKRVEFTLDDKGRHPVFDWAVGASARAVEVKRFKAD